MRHSTKPHIYGAWDFQVNRQFNSPRAVSKESPFVIYSFFSLCNVKKIANESVSRSDFNFINPQDVHCFLKVFKKRNQFLCTGLMRSGKLVHLDCKNLTCFIQNLDQNLTNLVSNSKSNWSTQNIAKTLQHSTKPHICCIRGIKINRQVKSPRAISKESPFVTFSFFLTF